MNEEDFLYENQGYGVISVDQTLDDTTISQPLHDEKINESIMPTKVGKDENSEIVTDVFYLIMGIICISLRDKTVLLPILGIAIILISIFKNIKDLNTGVIFLIIPSMISMISAYSITITTQTIMGIVLLIMCIISLILFKVYSIDIKIHMALVAVQLVMSTYIIYKYSSEQEWNRKRVIRKIGRMETIII